MPIASRAERVAEPRRGSSTARLRRQRPPARRRPPTRAGAPTARSSRRAANNPDLGQRFLDASIEGWNNYLYGDRKAAYAATIAANPEMTVEKLDAEMARFDKLEIIDSSEAVEKGIGVMNSDCIKAFQGLAVESKIIAAGAVDLSKVADTRFVNKGKGLDIKARLTGK